MRKTLGKCSILHKGFRVQGFRGLRLDRALKNLGFGLRIYAGCRAEGLEKVAKGC